MFKFKVYISVIYDYFNGTLFLLHIQLQIYVPLIFLLAFPDEEIYNLSGNGTFYTFHLHC